MTRSWKLWLTLVLVFAAGAMSGAAWTHLRFKQAFEKGFAHHWTEGAMHVLEKNLDLTSEQQATVRAILEDGGEQLKVNFTKSLTHSGEIMAESYRRVDRELTPEQQVIHRRLWAEFRERFQKDLNIQVPEK